MYNYTVLSYDLIDDDSSPVEAMGPLDHSAFELFMHRAANMPKIWENIMENVLGVDVACCMKTCKGLRAILAQCLCTSSRFQHDMNLAATASATAKGRLSSKRVLLVNRRRKKDLTEVCAIDNVLYCRCEKDVDNISFLRMTNEIRSKRHLSFKFHSRRLRWYPTSFIIHPTKDAEQYFLQRLVDYTDERLHHLKVTANAIAEITPEPLTQESCLKWEYRHSRPRFLRYRLFSFMSPLKDETGIQMRVFVTLGNRNGAFDRSLVLYRLNSNEHHLEVKHMASNEEVYISAMITLNVPNIYFYISSIYLFYV